MRSYILYRPIIGDKGCILQRLAVISIAIRKHKIGQFSFIIDEQVQLETKEKPNGGFAQHSHSIIAFVSLNAFVFSHAKRGEIQKGNPCL